MQDNDIDIVCSDCRRESQHGGVLEHNDIRDRAVTDIELVLESARALRGPTARLNSELWLNK